MQRGKFLGIGIGVVAVSFLAVAVWASQQAREKAMNSPAAQQSFDEQIQINAKRMLEEGKRTFRFDTFGSEDFWAARYGCTRHLPVRSLVASANG